MGIGTGARVRDPAPLPPKIAPDFKYAAASAGVGLANNREIVQLEGSIAHRFGPRFSLEYGFALTEVGIANRPSYPAPPVAARSTTSDAPTHGTLVSISALPYARPRWQL